MVVREVYGEETGGIEEVFRDGSGEVVVREREVAEREEGTELRREVAGEILIG